MINKKLLEYYIKNILTIEAPRWKKEKIHLDHPYEQIEKKYLGRDNVYFTMTDLNKTGIYPLSRETIGPLGVYCYPVTDTTIKQLQNNRLPYANGRAFIRFFEAKHPQKILVFPSSGDLNFGLGSNLTKEDIEKLISESNLERKEGILRNFNNRGDENPSVALYKTLKAVTGHDANSKTKILRSLGFQGVVDLGNGIIYSNEPTQAVFFSSAFINDLESYPNYYYRGNPSFNAFSNYDSGTDPVGDNHYADKKNIKNKFTTNPSFFY